jgi:hypothetical protein
LTGIMEGKKLLGMKNINNSYLRNECEKTFFAHDHII